MVNVSPVVLYLNFMVMDLPTNYHEEALVIGLRTKLHR